MTHEQTASNDESTTDRIDPADRTPHTDAPSDVDDCYVCRRRRDAALHHDWKRTNLEDTHAGAGESVLVECRVRGYAPSDPPTVMTRFRTNAAAIARVASDADGDADTVRERLAHAPTGFVDTLDALICGDQRQTSVARIGESSITVCSVWDESPDCYTGHVVDAADSAPATTAADLTGECA